MYSTMSNTASQPICHRHPDGMIIDSERLLVNLPAFEYRKQSLHIDDVDVQKLAATHGTPCYVYSKTALIQAYQRYDDAFASIPHQICYAVKANSNLAVLGVLAQAGAGFDIVTGGELARVLAAGGDASKVVFSGLGKTRADIETALKVGIACFNVESEAELHRIHRVAEHLQITAPVSLRVNPNVDANTHPYISTGLKENKFGIAHDDALRVYQLAHRLPYLEVVGVDCHIGSQILEAQPFADALDKLISLIAELKQSGIELSHLDLGGGLGVSYIDEQPVAIEDFADMLLPKLKDLGLSLYLEPGRSIVANAGVLLTRVDILKPTEHKNFAIVDAAMNDLIRPALYQSEMAVIPTQLPDSTSDANETTQTWDIVGAVCETGDFLAKGRKLALTEGEVLAITGAGAYGFVMSSNYNSRPRAAEVMVSAGQQQLIRARESIKQLYATECLWQE